MLRCLSDSELAGDGQRRDVGGLVPTVEEDNDLKDKLKERVAI